MYHWSKFKIVSQFFLQLNCTNGSVLQCTVKYHDVQSNIVKGLGFYFELSVDRIIGRYRHKNIYTPQNNYYHFFSLSNISFVRVKETSQIEVSIKHLEHMLL